MGCEWVERPQGGLSSLPQASPCLPQWRGEKGGKWGRSRRPSQCSEQAGFDLSFPRLPRTHARSALAWLFEAHKVDRFMM